MAELTTKPKPATGEAWGVINPHGDPWTYKTFDTKEAAEAYFREKARSYAPGWARGFTFAPVNVRVTAKPAGRLALQEGEGK